jgi:hypothetical protein
MKKVFLITFSLLIISLLTSCNKDPINPYEGKLHVEGQVLEKGKISKPIANAMVILSEIKSDGFFEPIYFIPIDTVIADKDGNYVLERSASGLSGSYHIYASADPEQYWNRSDEPVIGENIKEGFNVKNTLFIQPYGFVKVNIKNVNPVDKNDKLGISGPWSWQFSKVYIGDNINETFIDRIIANDTVRVSYSFEKTGIALSNFEKKYFAMSHDTLKLNINY